MPGELTFAPAAHDCTPVAALLSVSNAHSAIGARGLTSVVQSTRQYDASSVSPTAARKMSAPFPAAGPA